uniref:Uncharacterized protein n=1 Tax=Anguilla anguilla TaxID=7936 RepID=A0A0E9R3U3_ANGAN
MLVKDGLIFWFLLCSHPAMLVFQETAKKIKLHRIIILKLAFFWLEHKLVLVLLPS